MVLLVEEHLHEELHGLEDHIEPALLLLLGVFVNAEDDELDDLLEEVYEFDLLVFLGVDVEGDVLDVVDGVDQLDPFIIEKLGHVLVQEDVHQRRPPQGLPKLAHLLLAQNEVLKRDFEVLLDHLDQLLIGRVVSSALGLIQALKLVNQEALVACHYVVVMRVFQKHVNRREDHVVA